MRNLSITLKIWLSVGVFILGYMISTSLSQLQNYAERSSLSTTSAALFPAAQQSQQADAAFQRQVTDFGNAAMTQDASSVDKAVADGQEAIAAIQSIASIPGLPADRVKDATALASSLQQLLSDAQSTYRTAMSGTMTSDTQDQLRALASRTADAKASLAKMKQQSADDLHHQLSTLQSQSSAQSVTSLILFLLTMVIASAIVYTTIRRSITGPVIQVVCELSEGASQIASASEQVATASQSLAQGSSEQAASLEETTSSTAP